MCDKSIQDSLSPTCPTALYGKIREQAKSIAKKNLDITKCAACGYKKHIEVCHKKAISEFPRETMISVVNDIRNLVILCRNCHWEFDHGEMSQESLCAIGETQNKIQTKKKLHHKCCYICNNDFYTNCKTARYCSNECSHIAIRKAVRPSPLILLKELETSNYVAMGRKYGVSDNAIRKWIKWAESESRRYFAN